MIVDQSDYVLINQLQKVFERSDCTNRTFNLDNFYNPVSRLAQIVPPSDLAIRP